MHCQYCFSEIDGIVFYCPECKLPHHDECWKKNDSKCAGFNCKGKFIIYEEQIKEETKKLNTSNLEEKTVNKIQIKNHQQKLIIGIFLVFIGTLTIYSYLNNKKVDNNNQQAFRTQNNNTPSNNPIVTVPEVKETSLPSIIPSDIKPSNLSSSDNTNNETNNLSSEEKDKISTLLLNWKELKIKIFADPNENNQEILSFLTGKALKDVKGHLRSAQNDNAHKEINTYYFKIESFNKKKDGNVEVNVEINEKSDYSRKEQLKKENSYDGFFYGKYTFEYSLGNWKINDINLVQKINN